MNFEVFKQFKAEDVLKDALEFHRDLTGEILPAANEKTYIYATVAHLIEILGTAMNEESKQNFLRFALGERLDLKGEIYGEKGKRLDENKARTTIKCEISIPAPYEIIIAKGTRFIFKNYIFFTEYDYKILTGETFVEVIAICETAGAIEHIPIGAIKDIVDKYELFEKCSNTTIPTGGRERENDEEYRHRLKLIPESFTSAGSARAYEYWIKKASNLVSDVFIDTPRPNYLDIYVINGRELINSEEKSKIEAYIKQDNIKALNDQITIKDPTISNFILDIDYWLYKDSKTSKESVEKNLNEKLKNFTNNFKLGNSINTQDFIELCKSVEGVRRVLIKSPTDRVGNSKTLNKCVSVSLSYKGSEDK